MKKSAGIGIGSTSMLIIFVVLCLCTFSTLSFVSARADYRLARDTADAMVAYYTADDRAIEHLHRIESALDAVPLSQDESHYLHQCEKLLISAGICEEVDSEQRLFAFTEKVDDKREINVVFKLVRPTSHNHRHTLLQKWQTLPPPSEEFTLDETLELWNGEGAL